MKLNKNIKKQLMTIALERYEMNNYNDNNYYSVADIVSNETPDQLLDSVEEWLDENCSNGYFSRWTNFGYGIYNDAKCLQEILFQVYEEFGIAC